MQAQVPNQPKEVQEIQEWAQKQGAIKENNGRESIILSLDGRKGTLEVNFKIFREIAYALGIRDLSKTKGVIEVPIKFFNYYLTQRALLEKPSNSSLKEFITGDFSKEKEVRVIGLGAGAFFPSQGSATFTVGGNASIQLNKGTHHYEAGLQSNVEKDGLVADAYAQVNTLRGGFGLKAGTLVPFLGVNVTGVPLSLDFTAQGFTFRNPFQNPIMFVAMNALQNGFQEAMKAKSFLEGVGRFVGWSTGLGPAWETAESTIEKGGTLIEAIVGFLKAFIMFWVEIIKKLITNFVEAIDYVISLLREPEKDKNVNEEKAMAIVEKLNVSKQRNNTEEVEDWVKTYKGTGPIWFRGEMAYWEDVALMENYGFGKSPLAPWRWFQDKTPQIREKEQLALKFLDGELTDQEKERLKKLLGMENLEVGVLIYLLKKVENPLYTLEDVDVIKYKVYNYLSKNINDVVFMAMGEPHNMSYIAQWSSVLETQFYPTDPRVTRSLSSLEKFILKGPTPDVMKNLDKEQLINYMASHPTMVNLNRLVHLFTVNPELAQEIMDALKSKDLNLDSDFTGALGLDNLTGWKDYFQMVEQRYGPLLEQLRDDMEKKPIKAYKTMAENPQLLQYGFLVKGKEWKETYDLFLKFLSANGGFMALPIDEDQYYTWVQILDTRFGDEKPPYVQALMEQVKQNLKIKEDK